VIGSVDTVEAVARVCHEANRAWQQVTGDPVVSLPWDDAPQWQRDSAISGVRNAVYGVTPEESHRNWCSERLAAGWTYGLVKDETARTHPCLVEYVDLPPEQQAKDRLFVAIVKALTSE
jgi:hypothetical protein